MSTPPTGVRVNWRFAGVNLVLGDLGWKNNKYSYSKDPDGSWGLKIGPLTPLKQLGGTPGSAKLRDYVRVHFSIRGSDLNGSEQDFHLPGPLDWDWGLFCFMTF